MKRPAERFASVGLMVKHATAGRVKTRLAVAIGNRRAAEVHQVMAAFTLRQMSSAGDRRTVAVTPDSRRHAFAPLAGDRWQVTGQGRGDLGRRMRRLLRFLLTSNERAVLVGTDCPQLTGAAVDESLERLRHGEVVMGPADDGGYHLIGLRGPWREPFEGLFGGIDWGTSRVAEQTREAAMAAGLRLLETERRPDVDRPDDLRRLVAWARGGGGDAEFRRDLLAAVGGLET